MTDNIYFPNGDVPVVPKPTKKERAIIDACYPGWRENPETPMDYEVNLSCIKSARGAIKALKPWLKREKAHEMIHAMTPRERAIARGFLLLGAILGAVIGTCLTIWTTLM